MKIAYTILLLFLINACTKKIFIGNKNIISTTYHYSDTIKLDTGYRLIYMDQKRLYQVEGCKTDIPLKIDGSISVMTIKDTSNLTRLNDTTTQVYEYNLNKPQNEYFQAIDTFERNKFTYWDLKYTMQGLAIPLKFRYKIADSLPAQVESSFNASLAFGVKINYNILKSSEDLFGKKTRQFSITPGVLAGMSTTELSKTSTVNPVIVYARKAPVFSAGAFVMFGYNNINFGYSIGVDHAFGSGKGSWIYRGRIWHGLTIGFDIIKSN